MQRRTFLKLIGLSISIIALPQKTQAKAVRSVLSINEHGIVAKDSYLSNIASLKGLCRIPGEDDESLRTRLIDTYIKGIE